jgi:hypothetical protein
MTSALDTVADPLITPILALLKDAINAELAAEVPVDPDIVAEPAVATTAAYPVSIEMAGETALPILSCYRVRSRASQRTVAFVDHTLSLQFTYVSAATSREELEARWPLLDRVWRTLEATLREGSHAAHAAGAAVLSGLGIIDVPLQSALKRELYQPGGDYAYPAFVAEMDLVVQASSLADPSTLWPALSFQSDIYLGDVADDPADVRVISYTPIGLEERDAEPYEEEAELP